MAKAKPDTPKAVEKPLVDPSPEDGETFEQALEQLEDLVESMESDQAPLNDLIDNYEKGTRLYERCQQHLNAAQQRVDLIRDSKSPGEKSLSPFAEENESLERTAEAETNTKTDNGELF